jgi:hypothetical protein
MAGDKNPHRLFVKSHCDYREGGLVALPGWGQGRRQSIDFGHGSGLPKRFRPRDYSARKQRRMAIELENTFTVPVPPEQACHVLRSPVGEKS